MQTCILFASASAFQTHLFDCLMPSPCHTAYSVCLLVTYALQPISRLVLTLLWTVYKSLRMQ